MFPTIRNARRDPFWQTIDILPWSPLKPVSSQFHTCEPFDPMLDDSKCFLHVSKYLSMMSSVHDAALCDPMLSAFLVESWSCQRRRNPLSQRFPGFPLLNNAVCFMLILFENKSEKREYAQRLKIIFKALSIYILIKLNYCHLRFMCFFCFVKSMC